MRSAAILCPGPSLASTWPPPHAGGYVGTIAINHAILHPGGADWWAFADHDTPDMPEFANVRPRLGCVGSTIASDQAPGPIWIDIGAQQDAWRMRFPSRLPILSDDGRTVAAVSPGWRGRWSLTIALLWAATGLRATHIDLFGCDLGGSLDFQGRDDPAGRTSRRWQQEWEALALCTAKLAEEGVTVRRVRP